MKISKDIHSFWKDIFKISYENYKKELETFKYVSAKTFEDYTRYLNENIDGINGLVYLEDGECIGFLLYHVREENGERHCVIPEWGYGSAGQDSEKTISFLFQALASDVVLDKTVNFSVHLYAHDMEIQRLFSYMEFGIQAETGICILSDTDAIDTECVRELKREEIENRWTEIWNLLEQLIRHLRISPVFYPGEEFTQEIYKEFFTDVNTRVFVAEKEDEIIGVIEANADNIPLLFTEKEAANVGEVYVLPKYRGTGIAPALLRYVNQELLRSNYKFAWVEHGTANPNARGFWNRYFDTYKYEMIRRINR